MVVMVYVTSKTELINIEQLSLGEKCMCVYLIYIAILNSKNNSSCRFYFLYFTRRKWGSEMLSDSPNATPLKGWELGFKPHATVTIARVSCSTLHCPLPPPTSGTPLYDCWNKKTECCLVWPQLGMCALRDSIFSWSAHVCKWPVKHCE